MSKLLGLTLNPSPARVKERLKERAGDPLSQASLGIRGYVKNGRREFEVYIINQNSTCKATSPLILSIFDI